MKSQIDAQTPNDLKLTDAPEKQREALGGGTNANAASHVEEKGAFGAAPCSARFEFPKQSFIQRVKDCCFILLSGRYTVLSLDPRKSPKMSSLVRKNPR